MAKKKKAAAAASPPAPDAPEGSATCDEARNLRPGVPFGEIVAAVADHEKRLVKLENLVSQRVGTAKVLGDVISAKIDEIMKWKGRALRAEAQLAAITGDESVPERSRPPDAPGCYCEGGN